MLLWHVGLTVLGVRYAFRDERMDLRFLAAGAMLPDLIDTPLGLALWSRYGTVQLWAHSLVFAAVLMTAVVAATRRGRPRRRWMAIPVGVLFHLVLDAMWDHPGALLWPVPGLGFEPLGPAGAGPYLAAVLSDPWRWVGEAAGLAYLVVLARRAGLGDPAERTRFLATGIIRTPIGS